MTAHARTASKAQATSRIVLQIEDPGWRVLSSAGLRRAARLALEAAQRAGELTVLLTTDDRLAELNQEFRGKPGPTNVLSFPAVMPDSGYLGDIAVALGVAERESRAAGKLLNDHAAHLVVHGVLHLLGYDHQTARDARLMEGMEVSVLEKMGIGDPYVTGAAAG